MVLTEEEQQLLRKFGFRIKETVVEHKKMGIAVDISEFVGYVNLEDLQERIKELLRNT